MIKIKNYELGRDWETNQEVVQFTCKIYDDFLFQETNISDEQYIDFAKDIIQAIRLAREVE